MTDALQFSQAVQPVHLHRDCDLALHAAQARSASGKSRPAQEGFKKGQYWDTSTPYHYVRHEEHPSGNILVVGGEDHHTGIKPNQYEVCR
jgi:hypothetical protein